MKINWPWLPWKTFQSAYWKIQLFSHAIRFVFEGQKPSNDTVVIEHAGLRIAINFNKETGHLHNRINSIMIQRKHGS